MYLLRFITAEIQLNDHPGDCGDIPEILWVDKIGYCVETLYNIGIKIRIIHVDCNEFPENVRAFIRQCGYGITIIRKTEGSERGKTAKGSIPLPFVLIIDRYA